MYVSNIHRVRLCFSTEEGYNTACTTSTTFSSVASFKLQVTEVVTY